MALPSGLKLQETLVVCGGDEIGLTCLEYADRYVFFVSDAGRIGTILEASPDDPVDLGIIHTYHTQCLFGKDDMMYQLLARRLVEVVRKRILVGLHLKSLTIEMIKTIEEAARPHFMGESSPNILVGLPSSPA